MYKTAARKKLLRSSEYDLFDDLEKIRCALTDATHDARDKTAAMFSESIKGLKEKSADLEDDAINLIRKQPVKSVGAAVVAGVCFGFLVSFIMHR